MNKTPGATITVPEVTVTSWDVLHSCFEDLNPGWLFRGQRESSWSLQSSLERYSVNTPLEQAEGAVLTEAGRHLHRYLDGAQLPQSDLETMALIQHYGGPTRLIDWTASAHVALFFAIEDAVDIKGNCAVWALDPVLCQVRAEASLSAAVPDPLQARSMALGVEEMFDKVIRTSIQGVVTVQPHRLHERLASQRGSFVCQLDLNSSFLENLTGGKPDPEGSLLKLIVPNRLRPEILKRLESLNVTRATLFPGLEGRIQSLRQLVVREKRNIKMEALLTALKPHSPVFKMLYGGDPE